MERFSSWRPHPWHGLPVGPDPPAIVNAYIEITPFDLVKYEIDKVTGYLRVDRPQRTSSLPPSLYGFIPRTFCGERVAALSKRAEAGDGDPLDICVVTERPIGRSEVVAAARVVGVLRGIDHGRADDKIIAVLQSDPFWGEGKDVGDLPPVLLERLHHYFSTYKLVAGQENAMFVASQGGREEAKQIVEAAMGDYEEWRSKNPAKWRSRSPRHKP
jgi:inorganic pyrophosphatase